jgi:hypothetical protein
MRPGRTGLWKQAKRRAAPFCCHDARASDLTTRFPEEADEIDRAGGGIFAVTRDAAWTGIGQTGTLEAHDAHGGLMLLP